MDDRGDSSARSSKRSIAGRGGRKFPKMGVAASSTEPERNGHLTLGVEKLKQPIMGTSAHSWKPGKSHHVSIPELKVVNDVFSKPQKAAENLMQENVQIVTPGDGRVLQGRQSLPAITSKRRQQMKYVQEALPFSDRGKSETVRLKGDINVSKLASRRKSLPSTAVSKVKKELRRMSGKFMSLKEESDAAAYNSEDVEDTDALPVPWSKQKLILVQDGVLCIADQFDVPMMHSGDENNVKHLIYGEGYSGLENCEGFPHELVSVLAKTPCLQILELRGYWDFSNVPSNFLEYIWHFPRLPHLRKLVLPKTGRFLDKMGSIFMGLYGSQLESLECTSEFLEGCCLADLSKLVPNLNIIKVVDIDGNVLEEMKLESSQDIEAFGCIRNVREQ